MNGKRVLSKRDVRSFPTKTPLRIPTPCRCGKYWRTTYDTVAHELSHLDVLIYELLFFPGKSLADLLGKTSIHLCTIFALSQALVDELGKNRWPVSDVDISFKTSRIGHLTSSALVISPCLYQHCGRADQKMSRRLTLSIRCEISNLIKHYFLSISITLWGLRVRNRPHLNRVNMGHIRWYICRWGP